MPNFEDIRDPIIRMYAIDLSQQLQRLLDYAFMRFDEARRSFNYNPRAPKDLSADAAFNEARSAYFSPGGASTADFLTSELGRLSAFRRINDFFQRARSSYRRRWSIVDDRLASVSREIALIETGLHELRDALANDDEAKKRIYEKILGNQLQQQEAPYLFDINNYIIGLIGPQKTDTPINAEEGRALLAKEADELSKRLSQTNIDRRLLSALTDYVDALAEDSFSPIKVDLFSNKIRFFIIELHEELPTFAIAELSALLLSQERVLRQYPVWREFERDASNFNPDEGTRKSQDELLRNIAEETRRADGPADNEVREALERLEQAGSNSDAKTTTTLGVWRSVENYLKTNIRYVIDIAKHLQTNLSENQARYLRYLERLLPLLKLYAKMDPGRAWLLPVIQWLEDTLKTLK